MHGLELKVERKAYPSLYYLLSVLYAFKIVKGISPKSERILMSDNYVLSKYYMSIEIKLLQAEQGLKSVNMYTE